MARAPMRIRTISTILIIAGLGLAVVPAALISLNDARIARSRQYEAESWTRRYVARHGSDRPATMAPGSQGYLLEIPKIGLRAVVYELEPEILTGRNTPKLKRYGLGQVPFTNQLRNVSPGAEGTAAITGHRTTSGAPFRHLDRLRPGDLILVRRGTSAQRWTVAQVTIVAPGRVDAIRSTGTRRLALITCTPPFSDRQRLIVYARLS